MQNKLQRNLNQNSIFIQGKVSESGNVFCKNVSHFVQAEVDQDLQKHMELQNLKSSPPNAAYMRQ